MECVIYFEDYKTDALSRLFTSAYKENNETIRFSGGNGKLTSEVEQLLSNNSDIFVIAVLDMVPENSDIVTIYNNLKMIGVIHPEFLGRYIIIPNVCAEYRFIETFRELQLFQSREDVDLCLNKGDYKNSLELNRLFSEEGVYYKNFEKYCKFILKYTGNHCISSDSMENDVFQKFYLEDCECDDCDYSGNLLKDKACEYVNSLPFVLSVNMLDHISIEGDIVYKDLYSIHVELVNGFNKWVDTYKAIYRSPGKKYRHVTPMPEVFDKNIQGLKQKIVIRKEK